MEAGTRVHGTWSSGKRRQRFEVERRPQNVRTDIKTDQLMDTNRGERDDSKFLSAPRIDESTA